jgi:hypothetical protein
MLGISIFLLLHKSILTQKRQRFETTTCTTPPLTPKSQRFEPKTMHNTTIDPQKVKDSDPRPCTTPPFPKSQRFEPNTKQYTTIDPKKSLIPSHDHALHHHWPPKRQSFEPTTMHYTTIDPPKVKDSNPRPCTTPPFTARFPRKKHLERPVGFTAIRIA